MINKPIELLTQEQIKLIQGLITNLKDLKPIDCLMTLVTKAKEEVSKEYTDFLVIYENQPKALLLYFASHFYQGDAIKIKTPINENISLISQIETDPHINQKQCTYLLHKDSDIQFDLTYIDTYQEPDENIDDDDESIRTVASYLYGNPYSEDWTEQKRTKLDDIEKVIQSECDL